MPAKANYITVIVVKTKIIQIIKHCSCSLLWFRRRFAGTALTLAAYITLFAALSLSLSGCANYKKIKLEGISISSVKMRTSSPSTVKIIAEVNNPTSASFKILGAEGTIIRKGSAFAHFTADSIITVPSRGMARIPVNVQVSLDDPLSALAIGLDIKHLDIKDFTLNASAVVKHGMIKANVRKEGIPVERLLKKIKK